MDERRRTLMEWMWKYVWCTSKSIDAQMMQGKRTGNDSRWTWNISTSCGCQYMYTTVLTFLGSLFKQRTTNSLKILV